MSKLIKVLTAPSEQQYKWQNIFFVVAILTITALGFLVDGHLDSINVTNAL